MGVAGSGKSTVARALASHYGHAFLDADDFHSAEAKARMAAGAPLTDAHREPWVDALASELRRVVDEGHSCVLAFSGLRAAHRQRLRGSGVPLRFVFLHATPSVIAARLASRAGHFMPPLLLESQFQALQSPVAEPDVVAVDVGDAQELVLRRVIKALDGC
jgi:gluconokinase